LPKAALLAGIPNLLRQFSGFAPGIELGEPLVQRYNPEATRSRRRAGAMPIYEYRASSERRCEFCRGGFEVMQKISDARLEKCPQCGAPVTRQISAATIAKAGPSLDSDNIAKHGFTQYKRAGQGVYEKTAGKGPDVITDD
jgi:putative FmdB family regulatory protein